jgi:hypothetical protein
VDVSKAIPLEDLIKTLDMHGRLIMVALPDEKLPSIAPMGMCFISFYVALNVSKLACKAFATNGALLGGSHV